MYSAPLHSPGMDSTASTPPNERVDGLVDESEKLNMSLLFSNHAPPSFFEVACPTPYSVVRRIASELVLYIRYGFRLLGYLGLGGWFFLAMHCVTGYTQPCTKYRPAVHSLEHVCYTGVQAPGVMRKRGSKKDVSYPL